jgi:hypothetical protein
MQDISSNYGKDESDFQALTSDSEQPGYLEYSTQSQRTATGRHNSSSSYNLNVYLSGEIELLVAFKNSQSKPPSPRYGTRLSTGVSSKGRTQIKRAVASRVVAAPSKPVLLTLTTQDILEDSVFNRHLANFLDYARKITASTFQDYVRVVDLQQRGTLHGHLLLFERIPTDSFAKLRTLWAEKYELGPGSFNAKYLKGNAKLAGAYLSHAAAYLSRSHDAIRIGRNGKPYVRTAFKGNAYSISTALRKGTLPVKFGAFALSDSRMHSLAKTLKWVPDGYAAYKQCDSFADAKQHLAKCGITD